MITSQKVLTDLEASATSTVSYDLKAAEMAWNPTSTRSTGRHIVGPAKVTYKQWPDGGIDCTVR